MAFVHGKGTVVSIDGRAMSAYSNSVTFSREADTHDVTTFGRDAKVYAPGLTDGTASIEGTYDNTAVTGPSAVFGPLVGAAAVDMIYRPEGTASGRPTRTVSVLVSSFEESSPVADMVTWTAELQFSGAIVSTTQ